MSEWQVHDMTGDDLDQVLEIEAASHPTAWPRALFEGELSLAWSELWVAREAHASSDDAPVCGYIDFWLVHDELHVLNVAVAPTFRRRGLGRFLMDEALRHGVERGVEYVTLEVRVSNDGAIRLYETMGFARVGRRRAYYSDTGEDALIMALELAPDAS